MRREIVLAGGCFWGVEKYLAGIRGVTGTQAGYANGRTQAPSYEDVCHRHTGHAEAVRVEYDAARLPLDFLLGLFYEVIDPTAINRQGNDVGEQYRTGVYYTDPADLAVIQASLEELERQVDRPLAVEAKPLENFWPAEEYHQGYLDKHPGGYCHIGPAAFARAREAAAPAPQYGRPNREELRGRLGELAWRVTQEGATEPPFQNEYHNHFRRGIYVDITNGQPLFASSHKFESGCGWPAFARPLRPDLLEEVEDRGHGMVRTEVRSRAGNAHLGHVFADGPDELGGLRYCINSAALRFVPVEEMVAQGYGEYLDLLD